MTSLRGAVLAAALAPLLGAAPAYTQQPDAAEGGAPHTVRVNGVEVAVDFAVPRATAQIQRLGAGDAEFGVIVWAPEDDTPDSAQRTALFSLSDPPQLLASWVASGEEVLRLLDLDGDGRAELVRDTVGSPVCGATPWRTPAVFDPDAGAFRPVRIQPPAASQSITGLPRSPGFSDDGTALAPPSSRPIDASSGALDPEALVDGDPRSGWTSFGGGAGQWLALEAPVTGHSASLRLSTSEADGALRVLVDTGARRFETDVDGLLREIPLQPDETCVVLTVADLGGRPTATLSEAQIVLDADRLSSDARAEQLWLPALRQACADEDALGAQRLAVLGATSGAFTATLSASGDACEVRALLAAVNATDAPIEAALALIAQPTTSDAARDALVPVIGVPAAGEAIVAALGAAEAGASPGALGAALRLAVARRVDPLELSPVAVRALAASGDEAAPWNTLVRDLAPHATLQAAALWDAERDLDARRRTLHWLALATPDSTAEIAESEVLREALGDDDGSVARLAIHAAGRRGHVNLAPDLWAVAEDDPIGHLRAEAVRALDALDALDAGHVATLLRDEDPSVRMLLASTSAAERWGAADPPALDAPLSDPWPEVAQAWVDAAIAWGDPLVDLAIVAALSEAPVERVGAALRAWLARGTRVPDAAISLGRAAGADPATLTWTLATSPLSDAGCDTVWMQSLLRDEALPIEAEEAVRATLARCAEDSAP